MDIIPLQSHETIFYLTTFLKYAREKKVLFTEQVTPTAIDPLLFAHSENTWVIHVSRDSSKQKKYRTGYTSLVPAVQQGVQILFCLANSPTFKMKLTDICNHVGIHKSKGYSILNTLKNYGLVEKDHQTKTYSLGPALIFLSGRVLDNMDYRNTVAPFLEYLAKETNSAAFFGLIVDEHVFVIAKHEVDSGIKITIRLGYRFPITYGAHGKAIVAFLPKVEREKILAGGKLWFYGDISGLNVERLEDEFARCRQLGFARDRGEMDPRFNAVAAPVFGLHGKLIASLFVVGIFDDRLVDNYGYKVAECAKKVSYNFGADVDQIYEKAAKGGL